MNEDVQRAGTQENNNEKPECQEGSVWNPKTGGCDKEISLDFNDPELEISNEQPECPIGYVWNPEIGECKKVESEDGNDPELEISKNVEAEDITEDL